MNNSDLAVFGSQKNFKNTMSKYKDRIAMVVGGEKEAELFLYHVFRASQNSPSILQCTKDSVIAAMFTSAELGLMPNTVNQHAYVIPYGKELQFQIGYRGFIWLAHKHIPGIRSIIAEDVYEGDEFSVSMGTNPEIRHVPSYGDRSDSKITHSYAIIDINGNKQFVVLSRQEIEKIRSTSKMKNGPVWTKWFGEKSKICAIKRLFKLVPVGERVARAQEIDNMIEIGEQDNIQNEVFEYDYDSGGMRPASEADLSNLIGG